MIFQMFIILNKPKMIKLILDNTNRVLVRYNNSSTPSLWAFWHKWNYEHTLMKNILQFTNKVLKQVNKYHVFRWEWMVGLAGAFTALAVSQLQDMYYQIKIGYKPITSDLVIRGVLQNKAVSNKLGQVLDTNVFRNPQLQYYVHQVIINQVLAPQKQNIKKLILASIMSLNHPDNIEYFAKVASQNISALRNPIHDGAITFLNSPTMDKITASGLKSVLQSLFLKQFMADQINDQIKHFLKDTKNSEQLYQIIRQKVSF